MQTMKLAIKSIWGNKGRSFLTMLGIIIGVGAVIVIVGLGSGIQNYMTESFQSLGTDKITVSISGRGSSRSIDAEYMYLVLDEDEKDLLTNVSPIVTLSGTVVAGGETLSSTSVSGVSEEYMKIDKTNLSDGRYLGYVDISKLQKVCVVGSYINSTYYAGKAVGNTLKINGNSFKIVGALSEGSDNEEGSDDDSVYIPYTVASRLNQNATISSFIYTVSSEDNVDNAISYIKDALYEVFEDEDAYTVTSMSELLDTVNTMVGVVVAVLASIAAISLVVGGVGIMNTMLISVSERTREIGIRKAIGAKEKNILLQFVTEAAAISTIGGALGILFGYILCFVATKVVSVLSSSSIAVAPSLWAVLMAVMISAGIGILFGYLPAKKAARLNPIDALRFE